MKSIHFYRVFSALLSFMFEEGFTISAVQGISKHQRMYMELFTKDVKVSRLRKAPTLMESSIAKASTGCGCRSLFNSFNPKCRNVVSMVADMLMGQENTTRCLALAHKLRGVSSLHPMAWYTGLTMATFQRPDLRRLWKPSPIDVVPDLYINARAMKQAEQNPFQRKATAEDQHQCVILDERFAEDNGIENRMWYFREGIQVNAQHWFWHLTYPANSTYHGNRRGELFYYFHHHIMARYNTDRLANSLPRTQNFRLDPNFIMEEGYNPHLYDPISETNFVPRAPRTPMPPYVQSAVHGPTLQRMMMWNSRLIQSIDSKAFLYTNKGIAPITFDALIDTTEESIWSINSFYYGNLHNDAHNYIAYSTVWQNPNSSVYGAMGELSTSMRDPAFYQWHGYLDDLWFKYKKALPPYQLFNGDFPLVCKKIQLKKLDVLSTKTLRTFWSLKNLTLTRRLNFGDEFRNEFRVCAKYLNHKNFEYALTVILDGTVATAATVRIFLAPRFSENGQRFSLEEQFRWFFALDSYKTTLQPGQSTLRRRSRDSTLTVPWKRSLATLGFNVSLPEAICGCGWPAHLLLPKGTPKGQVFDLVVMLTDGTDDIVGDENVGTPQPNCISAPILAGVYHKFYPDRKPMGYPFDRAPFKQYNSLEEFVSFIPNMATTQITIVHEDVIRKRG